VSFIENKQGKKLIKFLKKFYKSLKAPRHKFPCVPNSIKFGGNTSYGSRMIHKKFENFSSSIG
jgi:hypothetical protein